MKVKLYIAVTVIVLFGALMLVLGANDKFTNGNKVNESGMLQRSRATEMAGIILNDCRDSRLGVVFLCDYTWEKKPIDADAVIFTVEKEPAVTFKIVKIDTEIHYIQQLSRDMLEAIGQYKEGFVMEETKVSGLKAIKVKAYSREDPAMRLSDYYLVRDQVLYAVMFSVTPKEKWDNYNFVLKKIIQSVEFMNY